MTLRYFFWRLVFGGENVVIAVWGQKDRNVRQIYSKGCLTQQSKRQGDRTITIYYGWIHISTSTKRNSVPFLCAGFRLGQPETALGGLLDILGMCPSMGIGLCGLAVLDIWISGKQSVRRGEQILSCKYKTEYHKVRYLLNYEKRRKKSRFLNLHLMIFFEPW